MEDGVLQFYRNNKALTFIWLRSETKSEEGELVFDRMSIALQAYSIKDHPKVKKQSFHSIEVYVRSIGELPAYFDIYDTNQSSDWIPEVVISNELDELPDSSVEKTQKISLHKCSTINDYLDALKQISMVADCSTFLEVLQIIMSHKEFVLETHRTMLCTHLNALLSECAAKNAHKSLQKDEIEILQITVDELQTSITDPLGFVELMSSLSRLKCPSLLQQVLSAILPHVCLNNSFVYHGNHGISSH